MTPAQRREYARSGSSIDGSKCKACQQNEGREMQKKHR
jgi:hypothetical protein